MKIAVFLVGVTLAAAAGLWWYGAAPLLFFADEFHEWPVARQVQEASLIARGEWRIIGNEYKCIIAEVLKSTPGVEIPFNVGQEFRRGNKQARPNVTYGEGTVLFFTGSPPELRYISGLSNGRVIGVRDTTLEQLRVAIEDDQRAQRASKVGSP